MKKHTEYFKEVHLIPHLIPLNYKVLPQTSLCCSKWITVLCCILILKDVSIIKLQWQTHGQAFCQNKQTWLTQFKTTGRLLFNSLLEIFPKLRHTLQSPVVDLKWKLPQIYLTDAWYPTVWSQRNHISSVCTLYTGPLRIFSTTPFHFILNCWCFSGINV